MTQTVIGTTWIPGQTYPINHNILSGYLQACVKIMTTALGIASDLTLASGSAYHPCHTDHWSFEISNLFVIYFSWLVSAQTQGPPQSRQELHHEARLAHMLFLRGEVHFLSPIENYLWRKQYWVIREVVVTLWYFCSGPSQYISLKYKNILW